MWFLCPRCHSDFPEDLEICPCCGADIQATWGAMSRLDKLVWALGHRDAGTRLRAARLLGQLGDPRAVPYLAAVTRSGRDPYVARAAVEALAVIGDEAARAVLRGLRGHPATMVREAVARALESGQMEGVP